jgi:hypothetical protein
MATGEEILSSTEKFIKTTDTFISKVDVLIKSVDDLVNKTKKEKKEEETKTKPKDFLRKEDKSEKLRKETVVTNSWLAKIFKKKDKGGDGIGGMLSFLASPLGMGLLLAAGVGLIGALLSNTKIRDIIGKLFDGLIQNVADKAKDIRDANDTVIKNSQDTIKKAKEDEYKDFRKIQHGGRFNTTDALEIAKLKKEINSTQAELNTEIAKNNNVDNNGLPTVKTGISLLHDIFFGSKNKIAGIKPVIQSREDKLKQELDEKTAKLKKLVEGNDPHNLAKGKKEILSPEEIKRIVEEKTKGTKVRPETARALIMAESGRDRYALGHDEQGNLAPTGGMGEMQLVKSTGEQYGLKGEDFFDPEKNIGAGVQYLNHLLEIFNGDEKKALEAYRGRKTQQDPKYFEKIERLEKQYTLQQNNAKNLPTVMVSALNKSTLTVNLHPDTIKVLAENITEGNKDLIPKGQVPLSLNYQGSSWN